MSSFLNISEAASIGWHGMIVLADSEGKLRPTSWIAERLQVSGAHLSKVLQRLARAGLVDAVRGPRGGFRLGKPAREITILQIYEAIEGPIRKYTCLLRKPICRGSCCLIGDLLRQTDELYGHLATLTLEEATEQSLHEPPSREGPPTQ